MEGSGLHGGEVLMLRIRNGIHYWSNDFSRFYILSVSGLFRHTITQDDAEVARIRGELRVCPKVCCTVTDFLETHSYVVVEGRCHGAHRFER